MPVAPQSRANSRCQTPLSSFYSSSSPGQALWPPSFLLLLIVVVIALPLALLSFTCFSGISPTSIDLVGTDRRTSSLLRGTSHTAPVGILNQEGAAPPSRRLRSGPESESDNDSDNDNDNDQPSQGSAPHHAARVDSDRSSDMGQPKSAAPPPPHSPLLVGLGLLLSLSAFLTVAVLALVVLATQCEVPVPLLAVFPTGSSSLLVVQLLTQMGRTASKGSPIIDLSQPLLWTLPDVAEKELCISCLLIAVVFILRRLAARSQRTELTGQFPHWLTVGAWELRAAGLLAFPLASASFRVLVSVPNGSEAAGLAIKSLAALTLGGLLSANLAAFNFVSKVMSSGEVVRVRLPATVNSAEVYTDRICNQLLALPAAVPKPSCGNLFGTWLASASWCASPTVAVVEETEPPPVRDSFAEEAEFQRAPVWCTGIDGENFQAEGEIEDEMQGRPLLKNVSGLQDRAVLKGSSLSRNNYSHSFHTGDEGNGNDANHYDADRTSDSHAAMLNGKMANDDGGTSNSGGSNRHHQGLQSMGATRAGPSQRPKKYPLSAVASSHWLRVSTSTCFEVKGRELVAGVACIPWLDCAVPAEVLKHVQEVRRPTMLQVHPGQLSGPLTSGRFSVCFDWGSCWPQRWCCEVLLKVVLGVWVSMLQDVLPFVLDFLILSTLALSAYHVSTSASFSHFYDNLGYASAAWAATALATTRIVSTAFPGLAQFLALVSAVLGLPSLLLVLLGSFGLAVSTLERLESQLLHERFLFRTIQGWGVFSSPSADDGDSPSSSFMVGSLGGGCGMPLQGLLEGPVGEHSVEVIMPGQRRAFAIVLPAMTRPRVEHTQLLPPMPARGGEPERLPTCHAKGDRARLPIPPNLLFPVPEAHNDEEAVRLTAARSEVAPLVALLVPGKPGLMVYRDAALNDYGLEWPELVRSYFGMQGSLLAEETERLVSEKEEQRRARRRQARQEWSAGGRRGEGEGGSSRRRRRRQQVADDSPKAASTSSSSSTKKASKPTLENRQMEDDRTEAAITQLATADIADEGSREEKATDQQQQHQAGQQPEQQKAAEEPSPTDEQEKDEDADDSQHPRAEEEDDDEEEDADEDEDEVLMVVEVLPAFAAEFMDERHAPPAYGG